MSDVSRLPRDYDVQSTLLRVAEQARAVHVMLPADALAHGHGIERDGEALAARGRAVLAAIVSDRRGWFDRQLLAPLARIALPPMIARRWSGASVGMVGGVLGLAGLALVAMGRGGAGLSLAWLACLILGLGETLSGLRDEPRAEAVQRIAGLGVPALAMLFLGAAASGQAGNVAALAVAVALVALAALAARRGAGAVSRDLVGQPGGLSAGGDGRHRGRAAAGGHDRRGGVCGGDAGGGDRAIAATGLVAL